MIVYYTILLSISYVHWYCIHVYVQSVGLTVDLPLNVHLLTLERLDHTHHLLRLEHQYPIDEAPLNTTANVTLEVSLFLDILSLSLFITFL